MRIATLVLVIVGGCFSPHYEDCVISCASQSCPSGFACRAGMCRTSGASGDCPTQPGNDGGIDATDAPGPMWGTPLKVDVPGTTAGLVDPTLTPDMLEMVVMQNNQLFYTKRISTASPWSTATLVNISGLAGVKDQTPSFSSDGLTLMFNSDRTGGAGGQDIWSATRQARTSTTWSNLLVVDHINSAADDSGENMSDDSTTIVFGSSRATAGALDIYSAKRSGGAWSTPTPLSTLNEPQFQDGHPRISPDQLTIYFQTNRLGSTDLFTAHRATTTAPFDVPTPITELNTSLADGDPWVSSDGHHMFFSSNRDGVNAIYETSR